MSAKFKIESIRVDGPHAHVCASLVEGAFFAVSQGSELGSVRLKSFLYELKLSAQSKFLFELEVASDSSNVFLGEIVELVR
jgi:hypothetical protein